MISADVINCFNRIAHTFASLSGQFFGLELEYLLVLFQLIQLMKMYLRTIFGILSNLYLGSLELPFYGVVQGNRAALLLQLIILYF